MPKYSERSASPDNEAQLQPDSTSELQTNIQHTKTFTASPVPRTYIRLPKRGFPPNPVPENHVRLDQITDELYQMFCREVLDERPQNCSSTERKLLDDMSSSGNFGAAADFYDEILGELPVVMVDMRTSKVFLSPSLRERYIEKVIAVKKSDPNPICAALAHIQQLFVGFPPEIRLRHMLVAELEKQEPGTLSEEDKRLLALPPSARFTARTGLLVRRCSAKSDLQQSSKAITPRRCSARISKSKECLAVDSKNGIVNINESIDIPFTTKSTPKPKPMYINLLVPLDDYIYDKIAEVLAGRCSLESIEDESLRLAIENIRDSGDIIVEDWVEEQFFCPPGLRLRANDEFGRILVRKSEVAEVWRMCYATLNDRSQNEILNAVEAQYVGIATKTNIREVSKYDLLKGARVVFPAPPRCIGRKPMQYVQIDILAMEDTMYGERSYNQALFLTDLYSGYSFARALTDCLDLAIIVRHVMDIFGSFGPPEAYRTFSLEYSAVIIDVMSDIERLFKIPIKNIGVGGNLTRDLIRTLYRRAESELLATNRWVEALPFAVIEQNQRPSKFFDQERTPFEIMFGRHAWRDELCPPWVNPNNTEELEMEQPRPKAIKKGKRRYLSNGDDEGDYEPTHLDTVKDLKMYANSLVETRKRVKSQVLPVYVPVYTEDGKLVNPGTGYMFKVFDRVYVRNPNFQFDCRSSKQRPHIARYYRGIIVDIDIDLVDSMYKVLYWEDDPQDIDAMSAFQWPAADDTYDCASSWFGPWDVTASTTHLAKLRAVPVEFCNDHMITKRRTIDIRCRCDNPGCIGFAHTKCSRKLSTECCLKSPYDCAFHKRNELSQVEVDRDGVFGLSNPSFGAFPHLRTRSSEAFSSHNYSIKSDGTLQTRRSLHSQSSRSEKRYTFRDGILVEICGENTETPPCRGAPPVLRRRKLTEADEIALQPVGTHDSWFAHTSSEERSDVASTSDDTSLVRFATPEHDSLHSTTPSPTPSACFEVEIGHEDVSQHLTSDTVANVMDGVPRSRKSFPRLRNSDNERETNGLAWDIPEISLRPRVVPRRDHPYERSEKVTRVSPTARSLVVASMTKRLGKSAISGKRSGSTISNATNNEGAPMVVNGTSGAQKLPTTPRAASHVHPFDAELMAEGKMVDFMKEAEDPQEIVSHKPVVSSTSVPRRIYVVKATTSQSPDTRKRSR